MPTVSVSLGRRFLVGEPGAHRPACRRRAAFPSQVIRVGEGREKRKGRSECGKEWLSVEVVMLEQSGHRCGGFAW